MKAFLILMFYSNCLFAQQSSKIDSLENVLRKLPDDSSSVFTLIELSKSYQHRDVQKSKDFVRKAIALSTRFHDERKLFRCYRALGYAYWVEGVIDSSIWSFGQALKLGKKNNHILVNQVYIDIGFAYNEQSSYDSALSNYYKGLESAEKIGAQKFSAYGSIAGVYRGIGDYQSAAHFDTLALRESENHHADRNFNMLLLGNHAITLYKMGKLSDSRELLNQCITYRTKTNEKLYLSGHYRALGDIDMDEKRYDSAFSNYISALNLKQSLRSFSGLGDICNKLAMVELARRRIPEAKRFGGRSLYLSDSLNHRTTKRDAAKVMMMIALFQGDFAKARYYDSLFVSTQQAINIEEQARVVAEVNARYESERKEKENHLLKLSHLEQSAELSKQRYTIVLIGVVLIAVSVFLIILYRSRHVLKKTNVLLKATNEAVQIQQEEILRQKDQLAVQMLELRKTQSQLVHAEKMASLGQMTSGIAHEINNPLNFITGGVEGLKYPVEQLLIAAKGGSRLQPDEIGELESGAHRMMNIIYNGVGRAHRIITSLRTFAGPQGVLTSVNVITILDMALTILNNKIIDAQVTVVKNYPAEGAMVQGNSSELSQVFSNIIDNAIYAMTDTGRERQLTLDLEAKGEYVAVTIADTGSGIAPHIQHKIMEPFFTTKDVGRGTGLGLSISYNIVRSHGGLISFISDSGTGSKFFVTLRNAE